MLSGMARVKSRARICRKSNNWHERTWSARVDLMMLYIVSDLHGAHIGWQKTVQHAARWTSIAIRVWLEAFSLPWEDVNV